jgi:hypothetical protein
MSSDIQKNGRCESVRILCAGGYAPQGPNNCTQGYLIVPPYSANTLLNSVLLAALTQVPSFQVHVLTEKRTAASEKQRR